MSFISPETSYFVGKGDCEREGTTFLDKNKQHSSSWPAWKERWLMGNPSCLSFPLERLNFLPQQKVVMVGELVDALVKGDADDVGN